MYGHRRNGVTRYATPLTSTDDVLSPRVAGGEAAVDERGSSPPLHSARRPLMSCAFPLGSADEVFSRVVLCHLHGHHLAMFFLLVEVFSHVVLCYLHGRQLAMSLQVEVFSPVVLCHLHGRHLMVCSHPMYHSAGCHLSRCSRPCSLPRWTSFGDVPSSCHLLKYSDATVVVYHLHGHHRP